ncbi:MAG: hypothetical protein ACOYVK_19685 [Bacillota bacterium]
MRKKTKITIFLTAAILCFSKLLGYPFWDTLKSYAVMFFYDQYVQQHSTLEAKNIIFEIPNGLSTLEKDWYPMILHHHEDERFSQYMNRPLSLDILYSFGSFDFLRGCSHYYDGDSPYYGSFYGGYAVFPEEGVFGFDKDGHVILDEIAKVPLFDQLYLVLPSIGSPPDKGIFTWKVDHIRSISSYIGYENWIQIDTTIQTNGPAHNATGKKELGYIQYGKPHSLYASDDNYPVMEMKGRTYVKYIEELKGTFFLYVMARDLETIEACDKNFLSKARIYHLKL